MHLTLLQWPHTGFPYWYQTGQLANGAHWGFFFASGGYWHFVADWSCDHCYSVLSAHPTGAYHRTGNAPFTTEPDRIAHAIKTLLANLDRHAAASPDWAGPTPSERAQQQGEQWLDQVAAITSRPSIEEFTWLWILQQGRAMRSVAYGKQDHAVMCRVWLINPGGGEATYMSPDPIGRHLVYPQVPLMRYFSAL